MLALNVSVFPVSVVCKQMVVIKSKNKIKLNDEIHITHEVIHDIEIKKVCL